MKLTIVEEALTVEVVPAGTLLITEEPIRAVSVLESAEIVVQEALLGVTVQELHDVVVTTELVPVVIEMGVAGPQGPQGPPGPGVTEHGKEYHVASLIPCMTTQQRNALSPLAGMMVYNISTDQFEVFKEV